MVVDERTGQHELDEVFHALANPTRRDIVAAVMTQELSVSALSRRYPVSLPAVQKHVAVLERAGLVHRRRHGRESLVRGDAALLGQARHALDTLEQRWRERIARADQLLAEDP